MRGLCRVRLWLGYTSAVCVLLDCAWGAFQYPALKLQRQHPCIEAALSLYLRVHLIVSQFQTDNSFGGMDEESIICLYILFCHDVCT